ncbi:hypothetical protein F5Y09DRAFT_307792 [Xylaria sp. FL1042]|nr:hypothetical protein F5Y09DRAFT_307792 [Xylaria sp. FL1042]
MLDEVERRDRRISHLIHDCASRFYLFSPSWFPPLTPIEQARLGRILKRAMHQCDRIVDIAASEPPTPSEYYRCISDGPYELPSALLSPGDKVSKHNPLANPKARPKQIEYIQSLSLEDITELYILVNTVENHKLTFPFRPVWTGNEYRTVIDECVLRHGTWFLWRFLPECGYYEADWSTNIISLAKLEMQHWELGSFSEPAGLKMTLIGRFRDLLGGGHGDVLLKKIMLAVKETLLGVEEKGKRVKA